MSSPLVIARGAGSGGRAATARDYTGGYGGAGAIAEGASDLANVGARLTDAEYRMRAAAALGRSASRLSAAVANIDADPSIEPAEYERRYDEELSAIRTEEAEGLPSAYRDAYELELTDVSERARLALRATGRKRQLETLEASADQALVDFANEEARAESEADRAFWRSEAAKVLGQYQAVTKDPVGTLKRSRAYEASVAEAALTEGLAADPVATRAALERRAGPFATADEKWLTKAILTAKKREESLIRQTRAAARYAVAAEELALKKEGKAALLEAYSIAAQGARGGPGLTPDWLAANAGRFSAMPTALGPLLKIVEKGGRIDTTKPADPAYFRTVTLERALDPTKHVERVIDPELAGNQFEELVKAQAAVAGGQNDPTEPFWKKVSLRLGSFADATDTWMPGDALEPEDLDEYTLRAQEALLGFRTEHTRDPNDVEAAQLLDRVELDFASERGRGRPSLSGRGALNLSEDPIQGIAPNDVARVRQSLHARGLPATGPNIRRAYDRLVAQGAIVPGGLAGEPPAP